MVYNIAHFVGTGEWLKHAIKIFHCVIFNQTNVALHFRGSSLSLPGNPQSYLGILASGGRPDGFRLAVGLSEAPLEHRGSRKNDRTEDVQYVNSTFTEVWSVCSKNPRLDLSGTPGLRPFCTPIHPSIEESSLHTKCPPCKPYIWGT